MEEILNELKTMVQAVSDLHQEELHNDIELIAMGLDSLMLTELRRKITGQYQIEISLNEFFMELTTLTKIAAFIIEQIHPGRNILEENPVEESPLINFSHNEIKLPLPPQPEYIPYFPDDEQESSIERILTHQLSAMKDHTQRIYDIALQQLESFQHFHFPTDFLNTPSISIPDYSPSHASSSEFATHQSIPTSHFSPSASNSEIKSIPKPLNFSPTPNLRKREFTPVQKAHLDRLIKRYTAKTRTSKSMAQKYRKVLADSKSAASFSLDTKEMIYPIVGKNASGARIRDIDNNEYVDVTMGFGVYLFGHHPEFIEKVLREQPEDITQLGPRSYLTGKAAALISKFTGMERITFANTGTEAVMTAIRLARAATGRTKIAIFTRSYHGHSDASLIISSIRNEQIVSEPMSPGIPRSVVDETIVLDYLAPNTLDILRRYAPQLAAVLVEPIQSRFPGVNPGEFLRELRQITNNSGTLLIFDEMITGFRIHPGGTQAYFNVDADICVFGKVVGGGFPIGVIAGKAKFMDHIDGGDWDYGDGTYPAIERTFFGGTFCQNHRAMLAVCTVLEYLEQQGPELQLQLNQKTKKFADTLNTYFEENNIAIRVNYFASIFRFEIQSGLDLFYYHMLEKGVYIWEWRGCFLSTAHTEEDLNHIIQAVKETVSELEKGGFSLKGKSINKQTVSHSGSQGTASLTGSNYYPMSSVQKRMFVLSRTKDGDRAYHIPIALLIDGPVNIQKFQSVIEQIIHRHEILRTGFELKDDIFVQHIYPPHEIKFSIRHIKILETGIDALIEDTMQHFDLSAPPLLKAVIGEISPNRFIFITNFHHIVIDGLSSNTFTQEFLNLYNGNPLPTLKKQYKDYVRGEEEYLVSAQFKAHEKYWISQLSGEIPTLDLPTDFPRPRVMDFYGDVIRFKIQPDTTTRIKALARKTASSLNMFLLAIFDVLLFKLTGQEDMNIGIPASVRWDDDFNGTIGMCTNTLIIRNQPTPDKLFTQFLKEVKTTCLQAYSHQEFPYEQLIGKVESKRDLSHNPFIDVMFIFENGNGRIYDIPGLNISDYEVNLGASPFDLSIEIIEERGYLKVALNYRTKLFHAETIKRWGNYFESLIDTILENPDSPLQDIEILTTAEKTRLIEEFNRTSMPFPQDKTLCDLFEEQVTRTPDRIALTGNQYLPGSPKDNTNDFAHITYKQLDHLSDFLAHELRIKGVVPDTIVALMAERYIETIIRILAILKAGGAYLPIDPSYPQHRIDYMLNDTGAKLILTPDFFDHNALPSSMNTISNVSGISKTILPPIAQPHHLANVIYTSGSTGKPKGVLVEHTSIVNLVCYQKQYFSFQLSDRILQFSTLCFDASVEQIFTTFSSGAVLVLVDKTTLLDKEKFEKYLIRQEITHLHAVPFFLDQLNHEAGYSLKRVVSGGDICPKSLAKKWYKRCTFYNEYGPTETTVTSVEILIDEIDDTLTPLPIGKPLGNTLVYLLDNRMKCVPTGVAGEMFIGGACVARGYLNLPALTAERFITISKETLEIQTSSPGNASTFYKTGDMARWLPNGNIEFLGRRDHQVKIRGFRIELGEIETRLLEQPEIKNAVVIDKEIKNDKYVCAYLTATVPETNFSEYVKQLKKTLSRSLPEYMIPAYFIRIEEIPMLSSGKVNRNALPTPQGTSGSSYAPPENEIQIQLVKLFSDVLGRNAHNDSPIGIDDSFFDMGGHSLNGMIAISRIHKEFNVKLVLEDLFEAPDIRRLSTRILNSSGDRFQSIGKSELKEFHPVSSVQKRLYSIAQMEHQSIGYNMPDLFMLHEKPTLEKLENAFKEMIKRHESFRTSFQIIMDEPVQIIHKTVPFKLEYLEINTGDNILTTSTTKGDDHRYSNFLNRVFVRPFDLSQAPLMRAAIITDSSPQNEDRYLLAVDIHHIISDAISFEIFKEELISIYQSQVLPPLPFQYRDYTEWMITQIGSEKRKAQEIYWQTMFSGEIPQLALPLDFARPPVQSFKGKRISFEINKEQVIELKNIGKEWNVTLFMMLAGILNILLAKLSNQDDIVIGTPVAGRRHPDIQHIIGMFINTLAIRSYPTPEKLFSSYLKEIKKIILDSFENQEYPFDELVDHIAINRNTGRNPLFDVMLVLQNVEAREIDNEELKLTPCPLESFISKFDLTWTAKETDNRLMFEIEYDTKLFKPETIIRWGSYFSAIIDEILKNPHIPISGINILSQREKQQILEMFNPSFTPYPEDKTLSTLFEEQVTRTPDRIALVGRQSIQGNNGSINAGHEEILQISYSQLNEKANRITRQLLELGVQPDTLVAVMVERNIDTIINILGVLKAGGAYLPIDPDYPPDRIKYMMEDSYAKILLTSNSTLNTDPFLFPIPPIVPHVSPHHLAYVIYTSGSTGKPKGVMIEHASIVNYIFHQKQYFNITPDDRVLQLATLCFDASVEQLFITLTGGAALVLIPKDTMLDIEKFQEYLYKQMVTHLHSVPFFLDQLNPAGFPALKRIVSGGDVCPPNLARKWYSQYAFYNKYGPTETTVTSVEASISTIDENTSALPIGKPFANTRIFILDKTMMPLPIGIPGEMYIGGNGVARGYLNQPQLTLEKFIPMPPQLFVQEGSYKNNSSIPHYSNNNTLYRTGDLAKWLPDGNIQFLGRIDHQIKIRGFRIELGEIETRIAEYHSIEKVIVTDRHVGDDKFICAYIVSNHTGTTFPDLVKQLKKYLAGRLPGYMIPSYFIPIDEIPVLSNGKVNRNALPLPDPASLEGYIPPQNSIEEKLVEIWSSVLLVNKEKLGIDDNFFDLGGHSLKATLIISRIHKEFNVRLTSSGIFANPTIRDLAAFVKDAAKEEFIPIEAVEKKEYYPLSSAQKRLYIVQQMEPHSIAYNVPIIVKLEGNLEPNKFESIFKELISRHSSLRTSFEIIDKQPMQHVHQNPPFAIDLFNAQETSLSTTDFIPQLTRSYIRSFDLSIAPLLRIGLIVLGSNEHILMVDMHHIISDGLSMSILIHDFMELYQGNPLPPLHLQYVDFSQWQNHLFASGDIKKQERFWLQEFSTAPTNLKLPFDNPPIFGIHGKSDVHSFHLSPTDTQKIRTLAKDEGCTLFILFLSIFNIFLSKISEQNDIVVGTAFAGRRHQNLENIIGIFVNTLALRNYPTENKLYIDFLREVKKRTLDAFDNQDYQFENLVENVIKNRTPGINPLFDVLYSFTPREEQNFASQGQGDFPSGLKFKVIHDENTPAKFPMLFIGSESEDKISLHLEYDTQLFNNRTIDKFETYFNEILALILDNPFISLSNITITHGLDNAAANVYEQDQLNFDF